MRHLAIALALLCGIAGGPGASAEQVPADRTAVRLTEAVELPGLTLPPGEYVFKLLESQPTRHIVQVHERETGKIVITLLTVPAVGVTSDDVVVPFPSAPAGQPQPIQYWFVPGSAGHEFVYPREQAIAIAGLTGQPVLTAETTDTASMKTARVIAIDASGRRAVRRVAAQERDTPRLAVNTTPDAPSRPTAALTREPARVATPPPPAQVSAPEPRVPAQAPPAETLPDTAGNGTGVLLMGLGAAAAATVLAVRRQRA